MLLEPRLLWIYWIGSALLWAGLSLLVVRRWRLPQPPAPWIILGLALAVRVGYAVLMPPTLSDDLWRYLFDGQTLAGGANPYAVSPAEAAAQLPAEHAGQDLLRRINNPELVTIYQPTSQWFFAAVTWAHDLIVGDLNSGGSAETMSVALRLALSGVDLLIVLLLLRQLHDLGRSAWWAVMYAWHPLVVTEVAWSGHQDGLGVLFLLLALMLGQRAGRSGWAWWCAAGSGLMLGLAAGVKPIVLPLALPMAWKLWSDAAPGLRWWAVGRVMVAAGGCVLTLAVLVLPFLLMEGGMSRLLETTRRFVEAWRFNGSLHPLLEAAAARWFEGQPWDIAARTKLAADVISGLLLVAVLLASMLLHRVPWRAALTWFFALLCLSSTAHPWYLLWSLALLPVAWATGKTLVAPAVWVASLTLAWSYAAYAVTAADGGIALSFHQSLLIWLPVYGALGYGLVRLLWHPRGGARG